MTILIFIRWLDGCACVAMLYVFVRLMAIRFWQAGGTIFFHRNFALSMGGSNVGPGATLLKYPRRTDAGTKANPEADTDKNKSEIGDMCSID